MSSCSLPAGSGKVLFTLSASAKPGSIDLSRSPIAKGLMGTFLVVEPEVGRQARLQLRHRIVIINLYILVFGALPEPFHEHVVRRPPPPVPAHGDPGLLQAACVFLRREPGPLVGIKDLRPAASRGRLVRPAPRSWSVAWGAAPLDPSPP
jgi:hypothetical protein